MRRDFTLQKYAQLCQTLKRLACPILTIKQFLQAGQPPEFAVVLRHDVDRALARAMRMAELEAAYGLPATYYLRRTRAVFQAAQIRQLSRLGHEVGYHYEVLARTRGNRQQALAMFARELAQFRRIVPVETVSMHGSPLTPWNNLDIWQPPYNFAAYDLIGEAYLSIDYAGLYYLTDTGRSWKAGRYNLRDRAGARPLPGQICTTDDLIDFLAERPDGPVIINAHPNRWTSGWPAWTMSAASDWAINRVKWAVSLARRWRE